MEKVDTVDNPIPAHTEFSIGDRVLLVKAFTRIFWCFPLTILIVANIIAFHRYPFTRLPAYLIPVLLLLWGIMALHRMQAPGRPWRRPLQTASILIGLHVYFAPFIYWGGMRPELDYYTLNLYGLMLSSVWLLVVVNRLMEYVAIEFREETFFIEARLCRWAVMLFMGMPLVAMMLHTAISAYRLQTSLSFEFNDLHYRAFGVWVYAMVLLPYSLTMVMTWKTKELAFKALQSP